MEIKKVIIPIAGLSTRFLPLSKVVSKELWPLVDLPIIHYSVAEAKEAGIKEIIFVFSLQNKKVLDYFNPSLKIEKALKERERKKILEDLQEIEGLFKDLSFSYVIQKKPLGDGHAILQALKLAKGEPVACLFPDDVVDSKTPAIFQLIKTFKTCQKPVVGLYKVPKEKIGAYGVVGIQKIANRVFKIKKIVEKPPIEEAPSDLAVIGRYILTPEIIEFLKKAKPGEKGEIILAEVLNDRIFQDGEVVYGYEIEGKWLECGDKNKWLKSHLYLSLKHPEYGPELREYLKRI